MAFKTVLVLFALCFTQIYARRRCNQLCSRLFAPVCAVDINGNQRTFDNHCVFENEACTNHEVGWGVLAETDCEFVNEVTRPTCNQICSRFFAPVCAVDINGNQRTFDNNCVFEHAACVNRSAGWKLQSETECESVEETCSPLCTKMYNPVCAVDNSGNQQTFPNICTFNAEDCMNRVAGWKLLSHQICASEEEDDNDQCPAMCSREYRPVCGMDNSRNTKEFSNPCVFKSEACRNRDVGWREVDYVMCMLRDQHRASSSCRMACPKNYRPVCAINGAGEKRTFPNDCTLESESCMNRSAGWEVVDHGKC